MKMVQIVVLAGSVLTWIPVADELTRSFVGCYQLELGRWTRFGIFPATPLPDQIPPTLFELKADPIDAAEPTRFTITPQRIVRGRPALLDGWALSKDEPHSVVVRWSNGFSGVSLQLKAEGEMLRGRAKAFTDVIVPWPSPSARVVAVRKACGDIPQPTK
jgi:hypothetical protein